MMWITLLVSLFALAPALHAASPTGPVDLNFIDTKADPCDDFYRYACGKWIDTTELPDDRARWSRGFDEPAQRNEARLIQLLTDYSKGSSTPKNPYAKSLGDAFAACMDTATIEKTAEELFRAQLPPIQAMRNLKDLAPVLADLHARNVRALFSMEPDADLKKPSEMVLSADEGGLGLPSRDYYLSTEPAMKAARDAYLTFTEAALMHAGMKEDQTKAAALRVLELETQLAKRSLPPADRRDPEPLHHRLERKGLVRLMPQFDWKTYFDAFGSGTFAKINVMVPAYFTGLATHLDQVPLDDLKAYLITRTFAQSADAMDRKSHDALFHLQSKLFGTKKLPPRERQCLNEINRTMPFALARTFVEVFFPPTAKEAANQLSEHLKAEMRIKLQQAKWMDSKTRAEAMRKLDKQKVFMGYPDRWRSYEGLVPRRDAMLTNRLQAARFEHRYQVSRLGKPVDRAEWNISPSVVNAVNTISQNVIHYPAAILQTPNFDPSAPPVTNYGAMGTIVGHEITHAYDDQGRKFDHDGAVRSWWTDKTSKEFDRRAACVVKQFSQYRGPDNLAVNGRLVQGEAIADLGGMRLAYQAWKKLPRQDLAALPAGMTEDKLFFLSLAQAWCSKASPALERMMITSDPHPLDRFRVNGTMRNIPEFGQAFSCKAGATLAPKERCEVW